MVERSRGAESPVGGGCQKGSTIFAGAVNRVFDIVEAQVNYASQMSVKSIKLQAYSRKVGKNSAGGLAHSMVLFPFLSRGFKGVLSLLKGFPRCVQS